MYVSGEVHLEQNYSSKFPESLTSFSQVLQSLIEKKKYMFDNFFHCQKFDYFFPYLLYQGNLLKVKCKCDLKCGSKKFHHLAVQTMANLPKSERHVGRGIIAVQSTT